MITRWLFALTALAIPLLAICSAPGHTAERNKAPDDSHFRKLYSAGKYDDALIEAQKLLTAARKRSGAESIDAAVALNRVANVYFAQGKYGEAEGPYRTVIATITKLKGANSPDLAVFLGNLGNTYHAEIRYGDAGAAYARELAIQEKASGPDSLAVASTLKILGTEYWFDGRYKDAEQAELRALAIREKSLGPNSPDVAVSLNELGNVYVAQARLSDAEQSYKKALAINEKNYGGNSAVVATNLNNLGDVYGSQDRYAEAETVYKQSLAIRQQLKVPDNAGIALTLKNLGDVFYKEGKFADAEDYYKRSLSLREQTPGADHPDVAKTLTSLALLYEAQGKYGDAEALLSRALGILEKTLGPQHPTLAVTIDYLANAYLRQGKYDDAEKLYDRAIAIREKNLGPDHPDLAIDLISLGWLYQQEGDNARAELLFKRAVELKERALGPDHNDVGTTLAALGNIYYAEHKNDDAEKAYNRALSIKEHALGPKHPDIAVLLDSLANIYYDQKKYDQAEDFYKRALAISKDNFGLDHPYVASSYYALANLYKAEQKYPDAEDAYKNALAIYDKTLGPKSKDVAGALNNLIDLYGRQKRYADALPLVRRAIADKDAWTWATFPVLLGAASAKLIEPNEAGDDSLIIEQSASQTSVGAALNALAVRFSAGDSRLAQLVRRDQDLTAEQAQLDRAITDAVSKEPSKRDLAAEQQIRERIATIAKERDDLQTVFKQQFPDYAALSNPAALNLNDIHSLLGDDEALIIVDLGATSYVWAITKTVWRWNRLAFSAQQAAQAVAALRTRLDFASIAPFDAQASFALYQKILAPVAGILQSKPRLSFVVNGALTSLPPQLLVTRDPTGKALKDVDWLIRSHAVTVLPSVESLKVLRGKSDIAGAPKPLIGFADPIFDRDTQQLQNARVADEVTASRGLSGKVADIAELRTALPPLPDTASELKEVAASVKADPADLFLGADATETRVKQEQLDQFRIVYFATHGLLAGDVADFAKLNAEPALVLSLPEHPTAFDDGLLTASEIAQLKLDADWVVLSACNTASGEKPGAEALSGLARAFFYAGARSLVVSNWEVDSKSAVQLMVGTFAALAADPKLSHAEALQKSMLAMIDNARRPQWADPKYWAPFIVVGEPAKPGPGHDSH
jgi:CHAT domain-containing protein/Tfp pilus assembly protein PilF